MEHKAVDTLMSDVISAAADSGGANQVDQSLRQILVDVLGLGSEQVAGFGPETGLFGYLPELDSMAVATLLTEMEDRLHIVIEDDEVDGELLESYGALLTFAEAKRAGR